MNPFYKNLALWLVITLMMIMLYNLFNQQHISESKLGYSEFLSMVEMIKLLSNQLLIRWHLMH